MSDTPVLTIVPAVHVRDGKVYASSLDVAAFFGKQHRNVLRDIRDISADQTEFAVLNFEQQDYVSDNNQKQPFFDMTRDGFTLLVMGFTGKKAADFKIRYIQEFSRMEAALREQPFAIPRTMADALRLAADQADQIERQTLLLSQQKAVIEHQGPTVIAFERIAVADGTFCLTDAAKTLGVTRDWLTGRLQIDKLIYKRQGSDWIGYQRFIDSGWLTHKTRTHTRTDGSEVISSQVRVTSRGLSEMAKRYSTQGRLALAKQDLAS